MDSQERWTRRPIRRPRGGVCSSPRSMTCAISTRQRAIFGGSCRRRLRIARHRHRPWPLPKTQAEVRCSTTTTVRCRVRRSKSRVTSGSPWANSGRSRRGKGSSWCVCVCVFVWEQVVHIHSAAKRPSLALLCPPSHTRFRSSFSPFSRLFPALDSHLSRLTRVLLSLLHHLCPSALSLTQPLHSRPPLPSPYTAPRSLVFP